MDLYPPSINGNSKKRNKIIEFVEGETNATKTCSRAKL
jgi:hypothetical protein